MIRMTGAEDMMIYLSEEADAWISLTETKKLKLTLSSTGTFGLYSTSESSDTLGHKQKDDALFLDRLSRYPSPRAGELEEYWWTRYQTAIRPTKTDVGRLLDSIGFDASLLDTATRDPLVPVYVERTIAEQKLHAGLLHRGEELQVVFFVIVRKPTEQSPLAGLSCEKEGRVAVNVLDSIRLVDRVYDGNAIKQVEWSMDREKPGFWWWHHIRFADQLRWTRDTAQMLKLAVRSIGFSENLISLAFERNKICVR